MSGGKCPDLLMSSWALTSASGTCLPAARWMPMACRIRRSSFRWRRLRRGAAAAAGYSWGGAPSPEPARELAARRERERVDSDCIAVCVPLMRKTASSVVAMRLLGVMLGNPRPDRSLRVGSDCERCCTSLTCCTSACHGAGMSWASVLGWSPSACCSCCGSDVVAVGGCPMSCCDSMEMVVCGSQLFISSSCAVALLCGGWAA